MRAAEAAETSVLRQQGMWVVACRMVGIAATLASNILAARLLGPAEFGTYLLVTTFVALGSLLAMAGLNEAGLRLVSQSLGLNKPALASAYVRKAIGTAGVASLLAALAIMLAFAGFQFATRQSLVPVTLLVLLAVGIALLAWQQLGAEMLRAYGNLQLASFFSGGQTGGPVSNVLVLGGLTLAALFATRLDATLAVAIAVGSVCFTCPIVYWGLARVSRSQRPVSSDDHSHLSAQQSHELLTVGGVLLLNQLLAFAMQQLDILLAAGLLSNVDLGLYGAAKRSLLVAALPVQMTTLTIVASIPRLYVQSRMSELQKVIRSAATIAAVPSLIALGLLILFPGPIFSFLLRDSYSHAGSIVIVLAVGYLMLTMTGNPQFVLTMTGRHRAVLMVNLVSAFVLVLVGLVGAWFFGAAGLAAGSAASLCIQNGLLWLLARRELGIWTHVRLPMAVQPRRGVDAHELLSPGHAVRSDMVQSREPVPSSPV